STGNGITYAWSQTAGTSVTLSSTTVAKPTFTAPNTAGTLTFMLTVTSENGLTATDSVDINVYFPDMATPVDMTVPPDMTMTPADMSGSGGGGGGGGGTGQKLVANAGPDQNVGKGAMVTLDGTASTGNSLTFAWSQTAGDPVTLTADTTAQP